MDVGAWLSSVHLVDSQFSTFEDAMWCNLVATENTRFTSVRRKVTCKFCAEKYDRVQRGRQAQTKKAS